MSKLKGKQLMKTLKQWIIWEYINQEARTKPAPHHPTRKHLIDGFDSKQWMDYATAKEHSPTRVGFVLTENDPYFCIVLKNSLVDNAWNKVAVDICNKFANIYTEISDLNKGLCLFGKSTLLPHQVKRKYHGEGFELYFNKQFITFSEKSAIGNYNIDFTPKLVEFIFGKCMNA